MDLKNAACLVNDTPEKTSCTFPASLLQNLQRQLVRFTSTVLRGDELLSESRQFLHLMPLQDVDPCHADALCVSKRTIAALDHFAGGESILISAATCVIFRCRIHFA